MTTDELTRAGKAIHTDAYGPREFQSTYFALRVGLILSSLMVLLAPLSVGIIDGNLPPSISDSWYYDSRSIFVVGLATGASLLIVVRGDTQTEQTLLNLAGGLGLIVAGAACWPKDEHGAPLPVYDPEVAKLNEYAIAAILIICAATWVVSRFLPREIVGTGWTTVPWASWVLQALFPGAVVLGAVLFWNDQTWLAEHAHGPSAVTMFLLLAVVAFLRTSWGLRVLEWINDRPADNSLSAERYDNPAAAPEQPLRFDQIYAGVAIAMFAIVALATILILTEASPGWVLGVEFALLMLFGVFWGAQTVEAWKTRRQLT
jgi:hypothetical protein